MNSDLDAKDPCLSSFIFDRLLAGERDGLDEALAHLKQCESCSKHLAAVENERDASLSPEAVNAGVDRIIKAYNEEPSAGRVVRLSKPKMTVWAGIALAAAASVVLVLNLTVLSGTDQAQLDPVAATGPSGIRLKGATSFQVLAVDQGKGRILTPEDRVTPGDFLAFRVSVSHPLYVSVAGISERGGAYFLDHQKTAPWKIVPGPSSQLPVSAQLDAQPGNERLFALFCERSDLPVEALALIDKMYKIAKDKPRTLTAERLPSLKGCGARSFLVRRSE